MAGLFGGARMAPGLMQPTIGSQFLGVSPSDYNTLGASLKDALAYFSGRPEMANNLQPAMQQGQQAAQQEALAAQYPQIIQAMQSGDKGALNAAMAANPALALQIGPGLVSNAVSDQQKAVHTIAPEEYGKYGIDPATVPPGVTLQADAFGKVTPVKYGDMKSPGAIDQQIEVMNRNPQLAISRANLVETQRHNQAQEATSATNAEFGRGMTGKAYATLAKGLKDPTLASTPEYATAYQILSRPHVDATTGTIVTPDLSLYPRPVIGGKQTQDQVPTVTAFAPPNPSQAESASAGFANRLAASADIIAKNEAPLTSLEQRTASKIPVFGNYMVSPQYQKADQAERDFVNAQLRRESGAVISNEEFDNARKQYFPQPGDSKEVLEQKRTARQRAVKNMQLSAGNVLLPPGVFQTAAPPRGAPFVPQQQGFGAGNGIQQGTTLPRVNQPQGKIRVFNPATGRLE